MAINDHPVDRVFRAQRSPELSQPVKAFVTRSLPHLAVRKRLMLLECAKQLSMNMGDMYFPIKGS